MTDWSRLVKPSLVGVDPYDPGESIGELKARYGLDEVVKLNWNEGLFGPAPGALEAAAAELENAWMYPEQAYADFRRAVAGWLGVRPELIVPGHGIQALVAALAGAFVTPGVRAVIPKPTYGLYAQVFAGAGAEIERVPLRADLGLDLEAIAATARRIRARLAVVCDPNNPTGAHVTAGEWAAFLEGLPGGCVAVVDEAYAEYVDPELRLRREDDVEAGRPLLVLRTFSKIFGLAGLRLGYAVASEELAGYLHVVQEPFNVNRAALAAGRASLTVPGLVEERRREAAEARALLAQRLAEAGAEPYPSQANFVLVRVGVDDVELTERLRRRGVLVRAGADFGLHGVLRITVGPLPFMERVAAEIGELLPELGACPETPARPEAAQEPARRRPRRHRYFAQ
jgi:histidinol-phosphate aminotransferase